MRRFVGTAIAVAGTFIHPYSAAADNLDAVLRRIEALEQSNAALNRENAALRDQVRRIEGNRNAATANPPATAAQAAATPAAAAAGSMAAAPPPGTVTKAPNRWLDATTVTLYGAADLSLDVFDVGVFDQKTKAAVASNSSYFGVRVRHDLGYSGYPGWAALLQYETLVEASSTPSERAALGSRDSFVGVDGPYGALKIGKSDTPYKRSTALFDPFRNTIGDYNSIMGNTGGDARAEFDPRLPHSIWYESPVVNGFQVMALVSPGQNSATPNGIGGASSNFPFGEFNCSGSTPRSSGSGFPPANQGFDECTDGAFDTAVSVSATYKQGPFTLLGAYELHKDTNRLGDEGGIVTGVGVHDEWAAKVGGGVMLPTHTQLFGIYEHMQREGTNPLFNERSRDGAYASVTQFVGMWELSAAWAHAFKTPGDPGVFSGIVGDPKNQADMYSVGARYRFDKDFSVYLVGAWLKNGPGAHYCLGASGHGFAICDRDAQNNTIPGTTIKAASIGLTYSFSGDIIGNSSAAPAPMIAK
jgi:predicted porin